MSPQVSVVMPVYNGERYLAEAIASILGQTFADFEFIIVDDGSTDRSPEIVREYAQRDSRILSVFLEKNQGEASARNRGIERASGKYIAAMDSDDISLPDRLRLQLEFLNKNPTIGVLGGNVWVIDQDYKFLGQSKLPQEHPLIAWGLFFPPMISDASATVRRSILADVGGFEEGRRICDSSELWSRLFDKTQFANLHDIVRIYRRHPQALTIRQKDRHEEVRVDLLKRNLESLWGEAPDATVERLRRAPRNGSSASRKSRAAR